MQQIARSLEDLLPCISSVAGTEQCSTAEPLSESHFLCVGTRQCIFPGGRRAGRYSLRV